MMTRLCFFLMLLLTLTACDEAQFTPTLPNVRVDTVTLAASPVPAETSTPADSLDALYVPMTLPDGLIDELPTMSGICFEAAYDAAGQVFVLHDALEHIRFYGLADNAGLCRQPVIRYPFDFDSGRVLVGTWSKGTGCTARHDIVAIERDDAAKTFTLRLQFVTEGDCPYELVRPFWVSIPDVQEYDITLEVE